MSLKCQFCGEEYAYDRKICHSCEEKAIRSGLNYEYGNQQKWRCDSFLKSNNIVFGCNLDTNKGSGLKTIKCPKCGQEYSYGRSICHTCLDGSIPFGKIFKPIQKTYNWNCTTAKTCIDLLSSEVDRAETIVEKVPHREKLENVDHEWNIISSIRYNNLQNDENKLNYHLKFE